MGESCRYIISKVCASDSAPSIHLMGEMVKSVKADPGPTILVERAKRGDREAFFELVDRFRSRLEVAVRSRLGTSLQRDAECDDVLQETFLRALTAIECFEWKGEQAFFQWLNTIAGRVVLELASRKKRRPTVPLEHEVPGHDESPSTGARREERFDRLESALKSLSPDHREVILLARIRKLPIKVIAERMNRSPDAVTHLLLRALDGLKESFGDTESLHLPRRTLGYQEVDQNG